ncbi:MAG: aerotolerance regulator BatA, partial [Nitrospinaceae bacterium]|nr:aerotolerance regulator BatA [Nitrospinaceae bacterium]NIU95852.1 aerotolerance regulator BatA [Nitrospinaceae bacterium]
MNFFRFEDPWLLVLLALLPYLAWRARAPRTAAVLHFSSLDTLKTVRPPHTDWLAAIPWILRTLGMGLLILALARPQEGHTLREIV